MTLLCIIGFSCVNMITLLLCISIISLSISKMTEGSMSDDCSTTDYSVNLKRSIGMAALSLIGLIGLFARIKKLLRIYIGFIILACLAFIASLQMGFYAMHTAEGRHVEYVNGDEYKLDDFSEMARRIYLNEETWNITKKCLEKQSFCKSYFDDIDAMSSSELRVRYRLQGCCKPPKQCGHKNINATHWSVPETRPKSDDHDCLIFKNGEELCYGCDACKAAYIASQIGDRFQLTLSTIFWFIFCVCALVLACSTLETMENSPTDEERAKKERNVSPL